MVSPDTDARHPGWSHIVVADADHDEDYAVSDDAVQGDQRHDAPDHRCLFRAEAGAQHEGLELVDDVFGVEQLEEDAQAEDARRDAEVLEEGQHDNDDVGPELELEIVEPDLALPDERIVGHDDAGVALVDHADEEQSDVDQREEREVHFVQSQPG